jgi:hypothetical protein
MPDATSTLLLVIVVLLAIAVFLLIAIMRRPATVTYELSLDPTFREQVEALGQSAQRHFDINAVVELISQIEQQPDDIVERLRNYPATVQAAAWLHYTDRLGADLQQAQQKLSDAHQLDGNRIGGGEATKQNWIQREQQHVNNLRAKLDAAVKASGQPVGPRAV